MQNIVKAYLMLAALIFDCHIFFFIFPYTVIVNLKQFQLAVKSFVENITWMIKMWLTIKRAALMFQNKFIFKMLQPLRHWNKENIVWEVQRFSSTVWLHWHWTYKLYQENANYLLFLLFLLLFNKGNHQRTVLYIFHILFHLEYFFILFT